MKKSLIFLLGSTSFIALHAADTLIASLPDYLKEKTAREGLAKMRGHYCIFVKAPYPYYDDLAVLSGISIASYGGFIAAWKYCQSQKEDSDGSPNRYSAYKKIAACLSLSLGSVGCFSYSIYKTFRYTGGIDVDGIPYRTYFDFEGDTELHAKLSYLAGILAPFCIRSYLIYKEIRERKKASVKLEIA